MEISHVHCNDSQMVIHWNDDHLSEFDLLWLRDNCRCIICGDRSVGRKQVSVLELPEIPAPDQHEVVQHNTLVVRWSGDHHQSRYDGEWLRKHCYCGICRNNRKTKPQFWDVSLQNNLPEIENDVLLEDEKGLLKALSSLLNTGFVLIHHVPLNKSGFEKALARIGFLKHTNYGRVCDLKVNQDGRLLGDTNNPIPLHTDECYRHANPGMLAFQCLSTSDDGGGVNLLADGFNLASLLKQQNPDAFDLLCRIPVASRRHHNNEVDLRSASPVFSVDFEGVLQGIRYNERSAAPLDLPGELVRPMYDALKKWLALTRDTRYQVRLSLQPGDLLIFDNQRVLHGRDRFQGNRHLLYAQLDLDEPHSRARILAQRQGLDNLIVNTHRGT